MCVGIRAYDAADNDPAVRVIVFCGAGGHFGAGNDIGEFGRLRGDAEGAKSYGWAMAKVMTSVKKAGKPVIAAIAGSCYGASVALALPQTSASHLRMRAWR